MDFYELWLLVTCLLLIVAWVLAHLHRSLNLRAWVKRLHQLEDARSAWGERQSQDAACANWDVRTEEARKYLEGK